MLVDEEKWLKGRISRSCLRTSSVCRQRFLSKVGKVGCIFQRGRSKLLHHGLLYFSRFFLLKVDLTQFSATKVPTMVENVSPNGTTLIRENVVVFLTFTTLKKSVTFCRLSDIMFLARTKECNNDKHVLCLKIC